MSVATMNDSKKKEEETVQDKPARKPTARSINKLLTDLKTASAEVDTLEAKFKAAKHKRDELVAKARDVNYDISYKEISDATGMSISWINAALSRVDGHRPRKGRPRRL